MRHRLTHVIETAVKAAAGQFTLTQVERAYPGVSRDMKGGNANLREAVNQIRAPIGKARSVAKQQGDKANEMDDTLKSGLELMLVFPCEREGKQFS